MSESAGRQRPLVEAVRQVKNDMAERDDVVVEMREAQRMRLELLAQELEPLMADIPEGDERFDLTVSAGSQPRLWVDTVAHVGLGRDRRTYRFVKDTRLGRVVLAETLDIKAVARQVTRYVAERIVERERALAADSLSIANPRAEGFSAADEAPARREGAGAAILQALGVVFLGMIAGSAVFALFAWERVAAFLGI